MKSRFAVIISLLVLLFLWACAKPPVLLKRVVVVNATNDRITAVKVLHLPTRKTGEVNAILPQRTLNIGFSEKLMLANQAVVSWMDGSGVTRKITLGLPHDKAAAKDGRALELIYVIHPSGEVTVYFK